METLYLLNLIKQRIFEPRKKIIYTSNGRKMLENAVDWKLERKHILEKDLEILEESEGWNVADKDYVEYKITELYHKILSSNSGMTMAPSAPHINKTVFLCTTDVVDSNSVTFYNPGLFLNKGWSIINFTIFSSLPLDLEASLMMQDMGEKDKTQIISSKLKFSGKQLLNAECNQKLSSSKVVTMILSFNNGKKIPSGSFSLQLSIEL
nr:MAG: hypothetical protein DiTV3a_F4ORF9 [Diabrotica toursvirus 3a]